MKTLVALFLMMTILAGSVSAEAPPVTRHWQQQFWNFGYTDITVDVYQTEDNAVTVVGRFSNGQVLQEYAPYVELLIGHSDGQVAGLFFKDHLLPSFFLRTNVKTKTVSLSLPGPIRKVVGGGNDAYGVTAINCKGDYTEGGLCDMSSRYPDGLPVAFNHAEFQKLPNLTPCSGFFSFTAKQYAAGTATYTVCDPMTGEKSTKTRMLEGMERYPPDGGHIP